MTLDIKPFHSDTLNCLQDQFVAVALWLGRGYELMYAGVWGFKLLPSPKGQSRSNLGPRISADMGNYWQSLERYHGIRLEIHRTTKPEEVLGVIKGELEKGLPTLLGLDTYWNPLDFAYQGNHGNHFCLAVGLDADTGGIYCTDGFYEKQGFLLPYSHFEQGCCRPCITFSITGPEADLKDYCDVIYSAVEKVRGSPGEPGALDEIRRFAAEAASSLDIEAETEGYLGNIWHCPLYSNIVEIAKGRRWFGLALGHLAKSRQCAWLEPLAGKLAEAGIQWEVIRCMLMKLIKMPEKNQILGRIVDKIYRAADFEEQICCELESGCGSAGAQTGCYAVAAVKERPGGEMEFVDLTDHLNNKAFSTEFSIDCPADINSRGCYILVDKLPSSEILEAGGMSFKLPPISSGGYDNVCCNGQRIALKPGSYSGIMVLGCTDFGSLSETLTIEYTDGSTENIRIDFLIWSLVAPPDETVVFEAKCVQKNPEKVWIWPKPANLYGKICSFRHTCDISAVILPEGLNMHIFGLSLIRRQ